MDDDTRRTGRTAWESPSRGCAQSGAATAARGRGRAALAALAEPQLAERDRVVPMKHRRRIAIVMSIVLIAALATVTTVGHALIPFGSTYAPQQVVMGLRTQPVAWIGRTVQVRGMVIDVNLGNVWRGTVLTTDLPWTVNQRTQMLARGVFAARLQFNAPGSPSGLILRNAVPSAPRQDLMYTLTSVLSRLPIIGRFVAPPSSNLLWQEHIYQVRLLPPSHCPTVVINACPTGVVVS